MPHEPSPRALSFSRRQFIRAAGLAASAAAVASGPYIVRGQNLNSKLNVGVIGAGGKGASDTDGMSSENIVALCDIDDNKMRERAEKYPGAKLYNDYRQMLEEMKEIDTVTVSTPDHHHAPAAMMAIKLGKNVYCQKPLTHSVLEARRLAEAAREHKVATQMGNQGHSGNDVRKFCEMIWAGAIGNVREAHCWTNRPIWPQGVERPKETPPVPNHVDWYLFLGPAPDRPYHPAYHPFRWRGWWDFGTGALGDMACHIMDPANWALKLTAPTSIEATSEGMTKESPPKSSIVTYQFPAREGMPPVKLVWYDGGNKPSPELYGVSSKEEVPDNGALFVGDKGKITCETYGGNPRFTKDSQTQEFAAPDQSIPRVPGHYQEFIRACKGGPAASSNFDYAGPFTEWVLLGNVAVRANKKLNWDAKSVKFTNDPAANELLHREYREGWTL